MDYNSECIVFVLFCLLDVPTCYTRTLYIFEDANTTAIDVLEKFSWQESFCGSTGKSGSLYTMHVSPSVVLAFEEPPSTLNTLVDDVQCMLSVAVR